MLDKIVSFSDEFDMLPKSGVVLVAVSGGVDSMCLLEALLDISYGCGFAISAAHYNHRLRGSESMRDEAFVAEYCKNQQIPLFTGSGNVQAYAAEHGFGIEEAARQMRYDFLSEAATKIGAKHIATAHTADDNTETIIMNLARGAGALGLSGIPPTREIVDSQLKSLSPRNGNTVTVIRPMLRVTRDEVMDFARTRSIPFVEDSTNSLDIYTRNKVRHRIIPLLKDMNPRFIEAAFAVASLMREDEDYLSKTADEYISQHASSRTGGCAMNAKNLAQLPFAVSGRVIRKLCGGSLSYWHVRAALEICKGKDPSAMLSLPGTNIYREYELVFFEKNEGKIGTDGFLPIFPTAGEGIPIPGTGLKYSCKTALRNDIIQKVNNSVTSFMFKKNDICGRIVIRPRYSGDSVKLYGRKERKTLKKLFIEHRIPARRRDTVPVVADDAGVLAVYGIGAGDRAVPESGDMVLRIDFEFI